jgi:hypothetical protein
MPLFDKPLFDYYAKRFGFKTLTKEHIKNALLECKLWQGQWPANCYLDQAKTLTSEGLLQEWNSQGIQARCDKGRSCYDILVTTPIGYRHSAPSSQGVIPIHKMNQIRQSLAQGNQAATANWEKYVDSTNRNQPNQPYKTSFGSPVSIYGPQHNRP